MSRDDTTILDILNACRRVGDFLSGLNRDAFLQDHKTQSAVLHQLLLIGEATKRLSTEFRAMHRQHRRDLSRVRLETPIPLQRRRGCRSLRASDGWWVTQRLRASVVISTVVHSSYILTTRAAGACGLSHAARRSSCP